MQRKIERKKKYKPRWAHKKTALKSTDTANTQESHLFHWQHTFILFRYFFRCFVFEKKNKIEFPLFHRHEFVLVFPRLQRTNFGPASKMLQQINICASMKVADSLHKIFTTPNLCIWDSEKKIVKFKRSQHFSVLVFDEDPVFTSFLRHVELIFESIQIVLLDFSTRVVLLILTHNLYCSKPTALTNI